MDIEIDFTKTAQENANDYYERAKKLASKKEGALKAIKDLERSIVKLKKSEKAVEGKKILKLRDKKWYEKFHWFVASGSKLVIAGRDAHQNELINSKHFDDNDLFFHANIFGAAVTILKDGVNSEKNTREEVAQFAASYSSAWKESLQSIDVYALKRDQVSKSTSKGSVGTGSFLLSGEREWFRNARLGLAMFVKDDVLNTVPQVEIDRLNPEITRMVKIEIGKDRKSDAAKKVSSLLKYDNIDEIMQQLPAGTFDVKLIARDK